MIIMPKSKAGKWSLALAAAALVVFIASRIGLVFGMHPEFESPAVTAFNWNLVIMVSYLLCLAAAVSGLAGIIRDKERSIMVYVVTLGGFVMILTIISSWLYFYFNLHEAHKRLPGR